MLPAKSFPNLAHALNSEFEVGLTATLLTPPPTSLAVIAQQAFGKGLGNLNEAPFSFEFSGTSFLPHWIMIFPIFTKLFSELNKFSS